MKEITVSLNSDVVDQLQELATRTGKSRGEVVRLAISEYLSRTQRTTNTRLIALAEFNSAALDVMMEENYPSRRHKLVDEVARRMEVFHGLR